MGEKERSEGKSQSGFQPGAVPERVRKGKAVIESREPGVHQFLPVEYQRRTGNFIGVEGKTA
jgi:hypothetical protein